MYCKISIITPLYNKENHLSNTLKSVFNQTYSDFEQIIVDGGSIDGSLDIVNKYKDPRITLYHQKGRGVSAARNEGISNAKGELIVFLDADDEWEPDYLQTIWMLYQTYPDAGIYATSYTIQTENRKTVIHCTDVPDDFTGILPSYYHAIATGPQPIITSGIAIPKKILENVGGFNEAMRIGEDLDLWARIALQYPIVYSSRPLCTYNTNTENNHKSAIDNENYRKTPFMDYISNPDMTNNTYYEKKENISLYISYLYVLQAQKYAAVGKKKEAKQALTKATHPKILPKKIGCWIYITLPEKYFKIILKITGKFTNIGQTL
ncbi:glycosyltransferase [Methanocorpusculum sp. MG]|uniref:Glycosyltransferase n=1 Tax=Methanocorpusculum petauri TaxID=3002863 RepID=A0ABT4II51_9EURY|nr:glycosyltransferase [Methanocorpusculum petauri]MCZ0860835.1 glycosyltransferase [Methanocorpusculum petauri]